jgi:hypothetical protein
MSGTRVYQRVSSYSRGPGFLVLLALGWTLEWIDESYWSVLMSQAETRPNAEES